MRHVRNAVGVAAIAVFVLLLAGCGNSEVTPTIAPTTTAPSVTTNQPATTTAIVEDEGPLPLPSSGFLEPGTEYVTTVFDPVVSYTTDEKLLLQPFQNESTTGLQSHHNLGFMVATEEKAGLGPYKGVVIHNVWRRLTLPAAVALVEGIDEIVVVTTSQIEIGGLPGTLLDVEVVALGLLYEPVPAEDCNQAAYCSFIEIGPMRIILLDTPAGTVLITIHPPADEAEAFFATAQHLLDGLSFPDLG